MVVTPNDGRRESLHLLARQSAEALRERDLFGDRQIRISRILERLGLQARIDKEIGFRGAQRGNEVLIRPGQTHFNSRFVILHEIGHAVLLRDFPSLASQLTDSEHEDFASQFAVDMLLPDEERQKFRNCFQRLESPVALVRAAQAFRFSIAMLLQVAVWDREALIGNNIWIRVKEASNHYTKRDPKLRVIRAYSDHTRWYVPPNKGFEGICGDVGWLYNIDIGHQSFKENIEIRIQGVFLDQKIRYRWSQVTANIWAMALRPTADQHGSYFIVLITPLG